MPEIQSVQHQPVSVRCRFAMTAADADTSHEFSVFEFPGGEECPKVMHVINPVGRSEDPIKSMVWSGGLQVLPAPKSSFAHNQGGPLMGKFIHQENLALFKKRRRTAQ